MHKNYFSKDYRNYVYAINYGFVTRINPESVNGSIPCGGCQAKVQAVLAGHATIAVRHTVTPHGQQEEYLSVTYKKQRTSVEETVQFIPELLLLAILESLTESEHSDEHNRYISGLQTNG